jgi:hypothetical protein
LFFIFYGAVYYSIPSLKIATIYALRLVIQCIVVRQAAFHYGIRFVTSVLAHRNQPDAPGEKSLSRQAKDCRLSLPKVEHLARFRLVVC